MGLCFQRPAQLHRGRSDRVSHSGKSASGDDAARVAICRRARAANPGEFTARAYFNGRLDLAEAEGVAATIAAGSEQELSAARRLFSGELTHRLAPITDFLVQTLALLEVGIDFTDEDVTFISSDELAGRISYVDGKLRQLMEQSVRFEQAVARANDSAGGSPECGKKYAD